MTVAEMFNLAVAAHQGGKLHEAAGLYLQILSREPDHAGALHRTGVMAHQLGRHEAALRHIRRAIDVDPKVAEFHVDLGTVLQALGRDDQAIAEFRKALELRPDFAQAMKRLGDLLIATGQAEQGAELFARALEIQPGNSILASRRFAALHRIGHDRHDLLRELRAWNLKGAEALRRDQPPYRNDRTCPRRLKIGYLAADFREPGIAGVLLPLLSKHDHRRFEIFCYSSGLGDETGDPCRRHAGAWRNIAALSDAEAANLIRSDEIDILVDLSLHAPGNRMPVVARKPAPVQAVYLSHLGTSGLSAMDFRLSDPYVDPPGSDLTVYSEITVRLPRTCFCFRNNSAGQPVVPAPAMERGQVTFGHLGDFLNVSPASLELWKNLLVAVAGSRLLLRCPAGMAQAAVQSHLPRNSVEFVEGQPFERVDVALDTVPTSGGIGICDALWMGVPVITLAGDTAGGRAGCSVVRNIGLPDLAAESREQYVALAADWRKLIELRPTLRDRVLASPLMDAERFAGDMEAAYVAMWRHWLTVTSAPPSEPVRKRLERGAELIRAGHWSTAEPIYRRILSECPDQPDAMCMLGHLLNNLDQHDEAVEWIRQAICVRPNDAAYYSNLGLALMSLGLCEEGCQSLKRGVELRPESVELDSSLAFFVHFAPNYDAKAILREHRAWRRRHADAVAAEIRPHANDPDPDRRLRIGYISADFRQHVVGRNLIPFFAERDRRQFEVFCYSSVTEPDGITEKLKGHADGWREVGRSTDAQVAEMIRGDGIDILVELSLHTAGSRPMVLARKPAPVQVSYLGYCSTTGMMTVDYRLSDPYLDPPGSDVSCYSEKTMCLPTTYWCYEPMLADGPARVSPAQAKGHVTFGCLNKFAKVSPAVQDLWARILAACPNSRMIVNAPPQSCRATLLERFVVRGVGPDRIEFVFKQPYADYMHTYDRIDIALDPFPWGGGITTCDALWMGVPVITLRGRTAVGRGSVSVLCNLG
ncbi:MAG TPA: tetratricopeptide repeat protein, partial [Tepidisphaeraceae bacterium]|nr:tetratricopeptide repeat protein [Tepidisphaeraceae bacterium]